MALNQSDPLFIAQQVVCAYPISDVYGQVPRYTYYALLVLIFVANWRTWLGDVFLGAAATYAGIAAIQAFILASYKQLVPAAEDVSIPFVSSSTTDSTLTSIFGLVTNSNFVTLQPDVLELDLDAITAIVVTGYLVGLPLQCWSQAARQTRALHVLILLWNIIMLAGSICALASWSTLNVAPPQYRFCYPELLDYDHQSNDGWPSKVWLGNWNSTIWNIFQNVDVWQELPDNCVYSCFNTSQILRRPSSVIARVFTPDDSHTDLHSVWSWEQDYFLPLIYSMLVVFTAAYLFLLATARLHTKTRVPIYEPSLLWTKRKILYRQFADDFKSHYHHFTTLVRHPKTSLHSWRSSSSQSKRSIIFKPFVLWLELTSLIVLIASMIISPLVIVGFIVWIEWFLRHDDPPEETASQISQWSPPVAVGLVLVSAIIMKFKFRMASRTEVEREIQKKQLELEKLEKVLEKKA